MPAGLILQRDVGRVTLGQELVQPEREQRPAGLRVPGPRAGLQRPLQRLLAFPGVRSGLPGELGRRELHRGGDPPRQAAFLVPVQPEAGLHPRGERVADQVFVLDLVQPAGRNQLAVALEAVIHPHERVEHVLVMLERLELMEVVVAHRLEL